MEVEMYIIFLDINKYEDVYEKEVYIFSFKI